MMKTLMVAVALGFVTSVAQAQTDDQDLQQIMAEVAKDTNDIVKISVEDAVIQALGQATFAAQQRQLAVDRGATDLELARGDAFRVLAGIEAGKATNYEIDAAIEKYFADSAWETASLAWIAEAYASAARNFYVAFTEYNTSTSTYALARFAWYDAAMRYGFACALYSSIPGTPPMPPPGPTTPPMP